MATTGRDSGGGVLGFAIAFLAFAFGGALGLPESVRLLVIGLGVLLAVLSAGVRGLGLAALVLGGVVLIQSIVLFGAVSASREEVPRVPTVEDTPNPVEGTTGPKEDAGYVSVYALTPRDIQWIEASWGRRSGAEQAYACAIIRDGISDAELQDGARQLEQIPREGPARDVPTEETEVLAFLRAAYVYTENELC